VGEKAALGLLVGQAAGRGTWHPDTVLRHGGIKSLKALMLEYSAKRFFAWHCTRHLARYSPRLHSSSLRTKESVFQTALVICADFNDFAEDSGYSEPINDMLRVGGAVSFH